MVRKEYFRKAREARGPAYTVEELRRMEETHEDRECPGCYEGAVYDTVVGSWVDHDGCAGTGKARVFLYPKTRRCSGCSEPSRDLIEVREDHESLTFFEGDEVCEACAGAHGVV